MSEVPVYRQLGHTALRTAEETLNIFAGGKLKVQYPNMLVGQFAPDERLRCPSVSV